MAEDIANQTDLTNCDREPIHIPGAILPHGALIVVDPATFEVLQVAGDTQNLLGIDHDNLRGRSLETVLRPDQMDMLRKLNTVQALAKPRHLLDPVLRFVPDRPPCVCAQ